LRRIWRWPAGGAEVPTQAGFRKTAPSTCAFLTDAPDFLKKPTCLIPVEHDLQLIVTFGPPGLGPGLALHP